MSAPLSEITDLHVSADDASILRGVDPTVPTPDNGGVVDSGGLESFQRFENEGNAPWR